MGGSGATGAGSGAAADRYLRRACASSSPLRDRLAPARLTSRRRGDGEGLPAIVAAKSFEGRLPTPSLLSGRFSGDGRPTIGADGCPTIGASLISASFIFACCAKCCARLAGCLLLVHSESRTCHGSASAQRCSVARGPTSQLHARNPAGGANCSIRAASVSVTH